MIPVILNMLIIHSLHCNAHQKNLQSTICFVLIPVLHECHDIFSSSVTILCLCKVLYKSQIIIIIIIIIIITTIITFNLGCNLPSTEVELRRVNVCTIIIINGKQFFYDRKCLLFLDVHQNVAWNFDQSNDQ